MCGGVAHVSIICAEHDNGGMSLCVLVNQKLDYCFTNCHDVFLMYDVLFALAIFVIVCGVWVVAK